MMQQRPRKAPPLEAVAVVVAALLASVPGLAGTPERPSKAVTIVDLDGNEIRVTADQLRAMPQHTEKELVFVGEHAGFIGIFDFAGVRLVDLLEKAKAAQAAGGYQKENMYLVFRGTDGYQVVASWQELMLNADGPRVLAVLEKDGEPLPPEEGAIRLLFPGDKYCGRSVKCLETIEIHVVEGVVEKKDEKPAEAVQE